jgi:transposase
MSIQIRQFTPEERLRVEQAVNNPATPRCILKRMMVALLASRGWRAPDIAKEVGISEQTVRLWVDRFDRDGLAGLNDLPRSGTPPRYDSAACAAICAVAQQHPRQFGLPYARWTLDRLQRHLRETHAIPISRSRLHGLLKRAGVDWDAAFDGQLLVS